MERPRLTVGKQSCPVRLLRGVVRLKALRKVLSVLLVLIIMSAVSGQIAAHSARELLADPAASKEILRQSGIYVQMETFLVDQLSAGFSQSDLQFTRAEVNAIVTGVLPAGRLQLMAEGAVEGLHTWFWSGAARPQIVIDLTESRQALPAVLRPIIRAKVEALPVCTTAQAAQVALTYKGGMPPCKSSSADFNRMVVDRAIPDTELQKMVPGRVDVTAELEAQNGPDFWPEMSASLANARYALNLVPYGWGVILVLLALLALLNLDRWYTPFGWMAAPLLLGGGLLLGVGLVGVNIALPFLQDAMVTGDAAGALVFSMIRAAVQTLFLSMRNISLIVSLAGLGSVIIAVAGKVMAPPADGPGAHVG